MSSASEKQAAKLTLLLRPGEPLVAGVCVDGLQSSNDSSSGPNPALANYLTDHGFDPDQNIAYRDFVYGYLGVTDSRLILAKSAFWGKCKPKHLVAEAPFEECSLVWYDTASLGSTYRALHLTLPGERFASSFVNLRALGRDTFRAGADALVEAFGDRATQLEAPDQRWLC